MKLDMKFHALLMIAASGLVLGACQKAESPAEVRHDVADARADAQAYESDARRRLWDLSAELTGESVEV